MFKDIIISEINNNKDLLIGTSHKIHANPEIGNQEFFACNILCDLLLDNNFSVETDIAGHSTGFIAKFKSKLNSGPTIGFLAEYDALPSLGHACGHNIIGVSSVGAAIALSKVLDSIGGEIVVFGCPCEEGGENGSAKASYVKANLFKDVDACMMIHPSSENRVTGNSLAVDPIEIEFFGKPAHAAACPEKGINALDAVIQLFNGINALRQQVTSDIRIHGIITHGGDAPNIIPEYTKAKFYIRASSRSACNEVTRKVKDIAKGSALSTGCSFNLNFFQNQVDNFVLTPSFDSVFIDIMNELGESINTNVKEVSGSTDAGNVSHVVPTIHPYIKIGPSNLISHSLDFCNAAASPEGDYALLLGAKSLSLTALKLITNKELLDTIRFEFKRII